jgi:hypothetical protein
MLIMFIQWIKKVALVAACVVSFGAQAAVIVDTEIVNEKIGAGWLITGDEANWTHDLSDHDFVLGSALSASLAIEFWDDGGFLDGPERASIIVGFIDFRDGAISYNPVSNWGGDLGFNSLASLNAFGMLEVTVVALLGDFYIGKSFLTVNTADAVSVPESSSLMLFALGLLGLVALRKRKAA